MLIQRREGLVGELFGGKDWYERLKEYFPEREMKSKQHFECLLKEKYEKYQIMEADDYVVVYFEQLDYIFIDYILVSGNARGKGIGGKVLDLFKEKGKAIILEVEPVTIQDPDSEKRIRFYERNDFSKMENIGYERIHNVSKELNKMDIYCWSKMEPTEEWVLQKMSEIYTNVHAYKTLELYGVIPQSTAEVLWLRKSLQEVN
ncbi:GNAT family N-acetyltransferase [Ureibacillus aquaedulcis]|uniref:GNAT family N-acetyltransferase n=1 Tax=Ureibacillus aquaedulcis TaxID=3058421 RepID=A0ABT8GRQ7_9BACL|nr:GNAT family N-acetyltransferase [Ureibacillus sp. BA0131]MDN4494093.1 GNAT family N-acetyltransferase [Ureibacillus sp. BA0131]